ncbi:MAG: Acyl-coenzyme A:6-aminopenicillanic-acid-acyltransferase 40 kDa form (Isopenicillin-N N-acyltransferase) [Contains: Acyl-coenzyme A:6-aminopenicillanic-acid-acyltransferase 11 kDa subunit; Acyl-coenzyme A:6-aminopenicillanic-acid-acyltransferase 29 kDa subunit] [uncultured Thermomicrobiales bacterium]|uniref:Acyl-coenzyme A:6-aminopenicillanic-acid-acyltransferase 40 kDa form (Isopenicillin-N N-acyltransferase) n=1 Tax=uncultured Thermomicrobiales bacterium TaxID=1645740 RepID=A0A6J4UG33_9BACT|nr:MAG: Acyl-coenzyme A:6-aminopenicillanic-acid-acyltransferase 40 kDa form (Isopenicillin-N N-acyltransferase) [Contains: Acyl-coenzyme A:6-aminopenicillanic-acid-acyltransferase 11 kDa subunit; Acyl-coenzyme A:6-aminopenicillanic-acid-acyltransferase 29 kDa subunit] [uncultured Thermomicrobiales bacterium]
MTLPLLHLSGSPYEQGVAHGRALGRQIAHNLDIYFARFEREAKLVPDEVIARARRYAEALEASAPDYHAGMRGIAAGAGQDLDRIAALNVRYELLYYQFGQNATNVRNPDGCTAFAVGPAASASGHLLIGENWDWIPEVRGALLHTIEPDGMETLGFTEAGIFGAKIGLNSAGIGLVINGMTTTDDDWSRLSLPFHARCRAILRSRDLDAAIAVVVAAPRACAANFLLAQTPDRLVNIEAAPERTRRWDAEEARLCHTNHFLDPRALGVVEPEIERGPDSQDRLARMRTLLDGDRPLAFEILAAALRDSEGAPDAICRHPDPTQPPEERYATVVSVIMDLHAQTLWISDGPPDQAPYARVALADLAAMQTGM